MIDKLKHTNHINDIELQQLAIKILDQANIVLRKHQVRATDFLTPYYGEAIAKILKSIQDINIIHSGGYASAERKMITIFPDYLMEDTITVPIAFLEITANVQFNKLTHRDYLGALLGLGIKREKLGDILIHNENQKQVAQIIVSEDLKDYLLYNLCQVGTSNVTINEIPSNKIIAPELDYKEYGANVSSLRLDAVVSAAYNVTRSVAQELINKELVRVNWEPIKKCDYELNCNAVLSIKGKGRVYITEILGKTRSNRIKLQFKKPL
ncbi:RNA-binding protein [Alkaliphilus pronyensis]|uniref:RNA-binding protein n=1 Tax=Alkaliphilus pronyensis TaxID=1482732 RepID=A0A6I0F902_9FIRM|nr:YlmH/Sll1252 family protein [Alkaliphilus pronyensis]KAB3535274.1 RNA-binding protein [Alkaliphilus pronyensis]